MTWDYRVMVRGGRYAAYEVYYEDGRITTCGADPTYSTGESPEDRAEELERYRRALAQPVLDHRTLEAQSVTAPGG